MVRLNLAGQRFGRLTAVSYAYSKGNAYWRCLCDCGRSVVVSSNRLRSGKTQSCGCFRREFMQAIGRGRITHGRSLSREYAAWRHMIDRCTRKKHERYADYGGRGIGVCDRWKTFENFYADMGNRPTSRHTLERRDNDLSYSPDNCYWATYSEQNKNRREMGVGARAAAQEFCGQ